LQHWCKGLADGRGLQWHTWCSLFCLYVCGVHVWVGVGVELH
jgi:hypothetical protein